MNVALCGRDCERLKPFLLSRGVKIVPCDFPDMDLMICCGGDGALLTAELRYPGILKMPVRDIATAQHCPEHSLERQFELLFSNALTRTELPKLEAVFDTETRYAVNDVFIHNKNHFSSLRFQVKINDVLCAKEIVGDGVGVSTVHGSTAYYRSITHETFSSGIGIAFNNTTQLLEPVLADENVVVKVRILRNPAELVFDNSPETIALKEGDVVTIRQSGETARILGLDIFMCPECRRIRREQRASGFENIPF